MSYDFKKAKSLTRPRDEAWGNWKSWKDSEIGDKVQGFVADAFYRPEENNDDGGVAFRSQRGITIKQEDGELINVGVKYLSFVLAATDNLRVGDPIVIEYSKKLSPAKKGQQGAKVFSYYGENLDANKDNPTVKELTEEDAKAGGSQEPVSEEEKKADEDYGSFDGEQPPFEDKASEGEDK